jgi:hypothetical protein
MPFPETSMRTVVPTLRRQPRGGYCLSTLGGTQAEYSTARTLASNPLAASVALASRIDVPTTSGTVAVLGRGGFVGEGLDVRVGVAVGVGCAAGAGVPVQALRSSKEERRAAVRRTPSRRAANGAG